MELSKIKTQVQNIEAGEDGLNLGANKDELFGNAAIQEERDVNQMNSNFIIFTNSIHEFYCFHILHFYSCFVFCILCVYVMCCLCIYAISIGQEVIQLGHNIQGQGIDILHATNKRVVESNNMADHIQV
jgi:hypothetical protein